MAVAGLSRGRVHLLSWNRVRRGNRSGQRPRFLARWITDILLHGSGSVDATFVSTAWNAVASGNDDELAQISEYAEAYRGTAEMALESRAQGRAFLDAVSARLAASEVRRVDTGAGDR